MMFMFAVPKPFLGRVAAIQRNAIRSWRALHPSVQICLFGSEQGIAEAARESGVWHVPEVARNEYGTPLLNGVFERARALAHHDVLCYANADMVFMPDVWPAVRRVRHRWREFLLSGRRTNLRVADPVDCGLPNALERLGQLAAMHGEPGPAWAMDYFVFSPGAIKKMPSFAVGRPGWDNWVIYQALLTGIPVIDATQAVTAVHQQHSYGHVPERKGDKWEGPEAEENRRLMGPADLGESGRSFNLEDATWALTPEGLGRRKWTRERRRRFIATLPILHPAARPFMPWIKAICRIVPSGIWRTPAST